MFAPDGLAPLADRFDLVAAVRHGWARFAELVPGPVADAVFGTLRDPTRLVAVTDDQVVLLDWALATAGPTALDLVEFTVGCASHVDLPGAEVFAAAREAALSRHGATLV